jgi:uncharacterized protein (TIGR00251 family)
MPGGRTTVPPNAEVPGCRISVHVIPRSSKISIEEVGVNQYRVKIHSSPVDGSANQELIHFLSRTLEIPQASIVIRVGLRSRHKIIDIQRLTHREVAARISKK